MSTGSAPRYSHTKTDSSDARLFAPTFERNAPPIIVSLVSWLGARPGKVLEIGAGSGQHACAFQLAFPNLNWIPSDPFPEHRASIAAWRAHLRLPEREILNIDAQSNWADEMSDFSAVVSLNVIHISPFSVTRGIIAGASRALHEGGLLIFYGPFHIFGEVLGEGNASFDAHLRGENSEWGIRDVAQIQEIGAQNGFEPAAMISMPAKNQLLILRKT